MDLTQAARKTQRLTPVEREEIADMYRAGAKIAAIETWTGRSVTAIYDILAREGIELRRRQSNNAPRVSCEVCGEPVRYVTAAQRKEGIGRFCSQACMGQAKRLPANQCGAAAKELLCSECKEVKPVAEFYPHPGIARGYQYWCRECAHAKRIERAKVPLDPQIRRRYALWSMYRLTVAQYDAMYEQQGGCCAICGDLKDPWEPGVGIAGRDRFLAVDHCHADGHVRGLLCGNCNHGLGKFKDDATRLLAAAEYLRADAAAQEAAESAA